MGPRGRRCVDIIRESKCGAGRTPGGRIPEVPWGQRQGGSSGFGVSTRLTGLGPVRPRRRRFSAERATPGTAPALRRGSPSAAGDEFWRVDWPARPRGGWALPRVAGARLGLGLSSRGDPEPRKITHGHPRKTRKSRQGGTQGDVYWLSVAAPTPRGLRLGFSRVREVNSRLDRVATLSDGV